jgi:osmotically inducible protein OsmC
MLSVRSNTQIHNAPLCAEQQTRSTFDATMGTPFQTYQKDSTMIEKSASVHWEGPGKQGQGQISTDTGALQHYPYGFSSRFSDDRRGTNPEELLAAAHSACFTMAFSFACDKAGFATSMLDTQAQVRLVQQGEAFVIDRITLTLKASVPDMDEAMFQEIAASAKRDCPLSKALASVAEIHLKATLVPPAA